MKCKRLWIGQLACHSFARFCGALASFCLVMSCGQEKSDNADTSPSAVECTSGRLHSTNAAESGTMRPGNPCIGCHLDENAASPDSDAPIFAIAGTVYPTFFEVNECVTEALGAEVEITDATGEVFLLPVNETGNFYLESEAFQAPYMARVLWNGREHRMRTAQTDGDCNACHTSRAEKDVPGRVVLP